MSALRLGAALAVLLLSACGKSSETSPAAASDWPAFDQPSAKPVAKAALPKACALVTAEQAETLLQQPVALMSDEPENCIWTSSGHPTQITMLMVNLVQNEDETMAQTVFNGLTGLQGNLSSMANAQLGQPNKKSGQELEEIGDEAWMSGSNMDLIATKQIVARKGAVIFNLNITGMSKSNKLEGFDARLIALAQSAVPQL